MFYNRNNFNWLACTAGDDFSALFAGVHGDGSIWADFADGGGAARFKAWCEERGWRPRFSTLHADRNRIVVQH